MVGGFVSMKKYAPARVVNPVSLQHLVKLQPGQSFVLSLDKGIYGDPQIEITDNFEISSLDQKKDLCHYTFSPTNDLDDWGLYSACLLGEVWISYEGGLSKLVIVQDCLSPDKIDNLTVINPQYCDIRVQPQTIMELIVYDKEFGYQDQWDWTWQPHIDLTIDEMGVDTLGLHSWADWQEYANVDPPHYRYARYPRTEIGDNQFCRQHHFWFRFGKDLLPLLDANLGVQHVGDFSLKGFENRWDKTSDRSGFLSVYLDLRKKYRNRFLATLGVQKRSFQTGPHKWPKQRVVYSVSKTPKEPTVNQVAIVALKAESLEDGCNVLSAKPPKRAETVHVRHCYRNFRGPD
jgi:hypothetical protein